MQSKALPPIPFGELLKRLKPSALPFDPAEVDNIISVLWPSSVRRILATDMCSCVENHGVACSHPHFKGIHFAKLALILGDIRKYRGNDKKGATCMPLNYHWLNEEMKDILGEEPSMPFLISEVIDIKILYYKFYKNLIQGV